eukprot:m.121619 g.121619  ORF g.121619 m.121619 type:complete len:641 (+) comp13704_c0_seq23:3981-5903(+)
MIMSDVCLLLDHIEKGRTAKSIRFRSAKCTTQAIYQRVVQPYMPEHLKTIGDAPMRIAGDVAAFLAGTGKVSPLSISTENLLLLSLFGASAMEPIPSASFTKLAAILLAHAAVRAAVCYGAEQVLPVPDFKRDECTERWQHFEELDNATFVSDDGAIKIMLVPHASRGGSLSPQHDAAADDAGTLGASNMYSIFLCLASTSAQERYTRPCLITMTLSGNHTKMTATLSSKWQFVGCCSSLPTVQPKLQEVCLWCDVPAGAVPISFSPPTVTSHEPSNGLLLRIASAAYIMELGRQEPQLRQGMSTTSAPASQTAGFVGAHHLEGQHHSMSLGANVSRSQSRATNISISSFLDTATPSHSQLGCVELAPESRAFAALLDQVMRGKVVTSVPDFDLEATLMASLLSTLACMCTVKSSLYGESFNIAKVDSSDSIDSLNIMLRFLQLDLTLIDEKPILSQLQPYIETTPDLVSRWLAQWVMQSLPAQTDVVSQPNNLPVTVELPVALSSVEPLHFLVPPFFTQFPETYLEVCVLRFELQPTTEGPLSRSLWWGMQGSCIYDVSIIARSITYIVPTEDKPTKERSTIQVVGTESATNLTFMIVVVDSSVFSCQHVDLDHAIRSSFNALSSDFEMLSLALLVSCF